MLDNLGRQDPTGQVDSGSTEPPPDTFIRRWIARIFATYVMLRWVIVAATVLVAGIAFSSLAAGVTGSVGWRLAAGAAAGLVLPLLVRWRLRSMVARRVGRTPNLGGAWFFACFNVVALLTLCLGFGDATGTALRRRGDWFLGETDGYLPRRYRLGMTAVGRYLERFDLPPEAQAALDDAARPQPALPPDTVSLPAPVVEGLPPLPGFPVIAQIPRPNAWYHPLRGPQRKMPPNAACRFGARRPGRRPPECELGHCGIDLFLPLGAPVHAVYSGTVVKLQRNAKAGGIAGRFVWLQHKKGKVISSYVHLDQIRADLKIGSKVQGGEAIGTLGLTGIKRSLPHLHFGLAIQHSPGRRRWVDPEPLLWFWHLPTARPVPGPATGPAVAGVSAPPSPPAHSPPVHSPPAHSPPAVPSPTWH